MATSTPNPAQRQHQTTVNQIGTFNPIDKSKVGPPVTFTANAAGTTTTIVGTNADAADFSVGDKFRLYTSANAQKEETVFTVTVIAADTPVAGSTTITFTPAAAAGTADTNYASKSADLSTISTPAVYMDVASCRVRLKAINGSLYTDLRLDSMTLNDMRHAIKLNDEAGFN